MFQVVANHWELIFILFTSPKYDSFKVERAMFQGVAFHFELIYCLLAN